MWFKRIMFASLLQASLKQIIDSSKNTFFCYYHLFFIIFQNKKRPKFMAWFKFLVHMKLIETIGSKDLAKILSIVFFVQSHCNCISYQFHKRSSKFQVFFLLLTLFSIAHLMLLLEQFFYNCFIYFSSSIQLLLKLHDPFFFLFFTEASLYMKNSRFAELWFLLRFLYTFFRLRYVYPIWKFTQNEQNSSSLLLIQE